MTDGDWLPGTPMPDGPMPNEPRGMFLPTMHTRHPMIIGDPNEFQLTEGEKTHPLWIRLKAHLEDRLALARRQNDQVSNSEADTAALRGKIAHLKLIIALDDDQPLIGFGDGAD